MILRGEIQAFLIVWIYHSISMLQLFVKSLLTDEDMAKLNVYSLGKQAVYNISFGVLDSDYQWSIIPEFIRIAKETWLMTAD